MKLKEMISSTWNAFKRVNWIVKLLTIFVVLPIAIIYLIIRIPITLLVMPIKWLKNKIWNKE